MDVVRALRRLVGRRRVASPATGEDAKSAPVDDARLAVKSLLEGLNACQGGDYRGAFDSFQAAFIAYIRADDRRSASLVQKTISLVLEKIDNPAKVRAARRNAVRMLRQAGLHDEEVRALFFLADFEAKQRDFKEAYRTYEQSLTLADSLGYFEGEAECLCRYARALKLHGRVKEFKRRLSQAREVAAMSHNPEAIAFVDKWAEGLLTRGSVSISGARKRRAA